MPPGVGVGSNLQNISFSRLERYMYIMIRSNHVYNVSCTINLYLLVNHVSMVTYAPGVKVVSINRIMF